MEHMRELPPNCTTAARPDGVQMSLSQRELNRVTHVGRLWKSGFNVEYISNVCCCSQARVLEIVDEIKAIAADVKDPRPGKRSKTGAPVRKRKATSSKTTK